MVTIINLLILYVFSLNFLFFAANCCYLYLDWDSDYGSTLAGFPLIFVYLRRTWFLGKNKIGIKRWSGYWVACVIDFLIACVFWTYATFIGCMWFQSPWCLPVKLQMVLSFISLNSTAIVHLGYQVLRKFKTSWSNKIRWEPPTFFLSLFSYLPLFFLHVYHFGLRLLLGSFYWNDNYKFSVKHAFAHNVIHVKDSSKLYVFYRNVGID